MPVSTESKRRTMHLPPHVHDKVLRIKHHLNIPMTQAVERMADATLEAIETSEEPAKA